MATASTLYDLPIIDAHTHTSGPDADGPPGEVVRCMDQCGVEMAFVFAPLLDVHGLQLRVEHYDGDLLIKDFTPLGYSNWQTLLSTSESLPTHSFSRTMPGWPSTMQRAPSSLPRRSWWISTPSSALLLPTTSSLCSRHLAQLPQRCQHTLRRMRGQVSERIAHR